MLPIEILSNCLKEGIMLRFIKASELSGPTLYKIRDYKERGLEYSLSLGKLKALSDIIMLYHSQGELEQLTRYNIDEYVNT